MKILVRYKIQDRVLETVCASCAAASGAMGSMPGVKVHSAVEILDKDVDKYPMWPNARKLV